MYVTRFPKVIAGIFGLFIVGGLIGCSMDASIQSLTDSVNNVFSKANVSEVTPASSQNSYSTRGFKVQASVSYQNAKSEGKSSRGYKVYTNVQGTIFKE